MPFRPRRTIEEIIQLHVREGKQQREVFVEGLEDKRFYKHFLSKDGLGAVAVLEIDTVEVPTQIVLRLGLADGHRGRVVALAALLEDRVGANQVVCIADADLDHFRGTRYRYSLLLVTDYTSIELYAFNPGVIQRILEVALAGFPKSSEQVLHEMRELLEPAFLVRVASDDLALVNDAFPEHSSYCEFDRRKACCRFRGFEYANAVFQREMSNWRPRLDERISMLQGASTNDPRLQIHGGDFRITFGWYVRQHDRFRHLDSHTISAMLLGFIDHGVLAGEPLFIELMRRLRLA